MSNLCDKSFELVSFTGKRFRGEMPLGFEIYSRMSERKEARISVKG